MANTWVPPHYHLDPLILEQSSLSNSNSNKGSVTSQISRSRPGQSVWLRPGSSQSLIRNRNQGHRGPPQWASFRCCCYTLVVVAALVVFEVESESAGLGPFSFTRCSFRADIYGLLLWPSLRIGFRNFLLHLYLLHNHNHNHNVNLFSLKKINFASELRI
jgi:hypothetical protein